MDNENVTGNVSGNVPETVTDKEVLGSATKNVTGNDERTEGEELNALSLDFDKCFTIKVNTKVCKSSRYNNGSDSGTPISPNNPTSDFTYALGINEKTDPDAADVVDYKGKLRIIINKPAPTSLYSVVITRNASLTSNPFQSGNSLDLNKKAYFSTPGSIDITQLQRSMKTLSFMGVSNLGNGSILGSVLGGRTSTSFYSFNFENNPQDKSRNAITSISDFGSLLELWYTNPGVANPYIANPLDLSYMFSNMFNIVSIPKLITLYKTSSTVTGNNTLGTVATKLTAFSKAEIIKSYNLNLASMFSNCYLLPTTKVTDFLSFLTDLQINNPTNSGTEFYNIQNMFDNCYNVQFSKISNFVVKNTEGIYNRIYNNLTLPPTVIPNTPDFNSSEGTPQKTVVVNLIESIFYYYPESMNGKYIIVNFLHRGVNGFTGYKVNLAPDFSFLNTFLTTKLLSILEILENILGFLAVGGGNSSDPMMDMGTMSTFMAGLRTSP